MAPIMALEGRVRQPGVRERGQFGKDSFKSDFERTQRGQHHEAETSMIQFSLHVSYTSFSKGSTHVMIRGFYFHHIQDDEG